MHYIKAKFPGIAVNEAIAWSRLSLNGSIHDHALAHAGLDQNFYGRGWLHGTTSVMYPGVIPVKKSFLVDHLLLNT